MEQLPVEQNPTEQLPVEQNPTEQLPVEQSTAQIPSAAQQPAPRPYSGQPYGAQPQPAAPVLPLGGGHPAPGQPAVASNPAATSNSAATANPTAAPNSDPFALLHAYPPAAPVGPQTSTDVKPRRLWISVVGAAAAAALIASLGTAGLMAGVLGDNDTTTSSSLATIGTASTDTAPVSGSTSNNPAWEKVAAAVAPSVVAIQVTTAKGGGEGSGVVIDAAGHVLTNNHVVNGADSVQVTLSDGRLYKATIVGTDPTTDLAVVQITDPPSDLSPAALGDSGAVAVGEAVMAVGNPLGLANTVTTGIISALDRPVSASAESGSDVVVTNAIQIDAAINPGNSGGPLFDAQGRVIGITSSIATLSGSGSQSGSIGLGFAIPINLAQNIAGQLVKSGTAEHAFLGVSLTDGDATADGTTRKGAVVENVTSGSPADKAKVQAGDVVVAIDRSPVAGAESLTAYVRERTAGDTTKLTLVRDGKVVDVTVTLAAKAAAVDQSSSGQGSSGSGSGGSRQNGQNPLDPFARG
ncbi:MAG: trypsin-like peptidase domain-containing protein [Cellulomonas sp.]|nr:trypsin-like peptidase domain-containing protein [Cellulomonas sp.]